MRKRKGSDAEAATAKVENIFFFLTASCGTKKKQNKTNKQTKKPIPQCAARKEPGAGLMKAIINCGSGKPSSPEL